MLASNLAVSSSPFSPGRLAVTNGRILSISFFLSDSIRSTRAFSLAASISSNLAFCSGVIAGFLAFFSAAAAVDSVEGEATPDAEGVDEDERCCCRDWLAGDSESTEAEAGVVAEAEAADVEAVAGAVFSAPAAVPEGGAVVAGAGVVSVRGTPEAEIGTSAAASDGGGAPAISASIAAFSSSVLR